MIRATLATEELLPPEGELAPPWPGRMIRLEGADTYVRDTPSGLPDAEAAFYVHGLGGSSQNWTDLAGLLSSRLDGHAIDLPGFGRSAPATRYGQTAMATRIIAWIEESGRAPVHLLGNSLGGVVCVRVAAARPDLVRTLTLISPAMPFLDPRRSVHGRLVPLLAIPRVDRLAARRMAGIDPADLVAQVLQANWADPSRVPDQRMAEAIAEARLRREIGHFSAAYVGTLRSLVGSFVRAQFPGAGSLWSIARRITTPTLVIAGMSDQLVDVRVAPRVARAIPDSRLLMLPNVGHVAQMEVPRLVARAVFGLLD
ncbi:pimeloyl-ACP methyl ester carboxylesterase [Allocatelliglobosispora scoriae]|uniref:Pimeloyl-ACP methyl ester carboxylesterase n=1 Tax=Allocatelliglobosispora scoriae TaxID=643052 RepID=A0A841BW56_9ACTN|nr:alpha/beta hydrolase [Allocatelliglobosispora scoriae]MBB5871379.1 pimeloyl-ACP methyl ester carboxylesterase [Allocatelliglobosispora scoriae]